MTIGAAQQFFLGASKATGGGAAGYQIERSLRFSSNDSGYLSRTPSVAGNRKTWTWAGWVKRSGFGGNRPIFGTDYNGASYFSLYFDGNNTFFVEQYSGSFQIRLQTTQVFRDPSAWYHVIVAVDTTQATASNRARIYVNGSEVTTFAIATYPSQNADLLINNNQYHEISTTNSSYAFNGYLADIHFIDGQALTPSSFTEVSATTGQLIPKAYTGSFGTNGFWLKFSDNSAATAAALGKDYSGNSNNWTPNNLSVTAGAGNDSLVDTPTSYGTDTGAGGGVRGNYATLNPLAKGANVTLSDGNLQTAITGESGPHAIATVGMDYGGNDFYCEFTQTVAGSNLSMVGLVKAGVSLTTNYVGADANSWGYYGNGNKYTNGSASSYGSSWGANDVIGIAYKGSTGELFFYKNGVAQNSGNAAFSSLTNGPYFFAVGNGLGGTGVINFGQRPFAYTAPSGFKALCDTNLTAPVIAKPNTVMDVKLYTGNGSTQTISGLGFSPDFVWLKARSAAERNVLFDQVRGAGYRLLSDGVEAEALETNTLSAFTSNGFSVGVSNGVNGNGTSMVAWAWDAGSSTVSNTQGSISSQVRANASAGFSVCTFTGNSTGGATVGHGLGVAPQLIFVKSRSNSYNWCVYAKAANSGNGQNGGFYLNLTDAWTSDSGFWNNTAANSTTFTLGAGFAVNNSGATYVAYAFAPVAGYSSFGSYTGNGSADGPFVYTGFRPRWVLIKYSSGVQDWILWDAARTPYNAVTSYLLPSKSDAEDPSSIWLDFTSNGFKIRIFNSAVNANSGTYIYAAFAENPFQFSRAR